MRNELRVIGGRWRGRKLRFPATPGLRPTPDRVRETLFNWLGQDLTGLRCLDLFAGSGALGFEAASRGAERVVMVEFDGEACAALKKNCESLAAVQVEVSRMDARAFLAGPVTPFDVVFLDPPFKQNLAPAYCRELEARAWLQPEACVYLETESGFALEQLPNNWQILRAKRAGEVGYHLLQKRPPARTTPT